ncbi:ATP-binding protein [Streptomyces sp. SPB162]|uniref:ATP-binding protein n=1 Tax=Streptomyces sp. SPB162 TaxID=2940560 RepID=UPI002A5500B0|nr:serine/threonine-protein kinase RsbW [Streptomyces sp. SPB162]
MDKNNQLSIFREAFFRRERRSVPAARAFVSEALQAWGAVDRRDDVLLCVSELATNALLHGVPPGRGFRLQLTLDADGGTLRVEVHDSGGGDVRAAASRPQAGDDEGGRGLLLVAELADAWGVGRRDPGKVVWCAFATGPVHLRPLADARRTRAHSSRTTAAPAQRPTAPPVARIPQEALV